AAPLRLEGAKRAGRVQYARAHEPARARLDRVGGREREDAVVAALPALEAGLDLVLRYARLESEERVGKRAAMLVQLRREVVRLGLALHVDELRLLRVLMHVQGDRALVVEQLGEDRPAAVALPKLRSDERLAACFDGVAEGRARLPEDAVAQAFVRLAAGIGRLDRRGEPALVDAAAARAEGEDVAPVEL